MGHMHAYLAVRKKRTGSTYFLLVCLTLGTPGILRLLLLLFFVFDELFLLLQHVEFLLIACIVRVNLEFGFVELVKLNMS